MSVYLQSVYFYNYTKYLSERKMENTTRITVSKILGCPLGWSVCLIWRPAEASWVKKVQVNRVSPSGQTLSPEIFIEFVFRIFTKIFVVWPDSLLVMSVVIITTKKIFLEIWPSHWILGPTRATYRCTRPHRSGPYQTVYY